MNLRTLDKATEKSQGMQLKTVVATLHSILSTLQNTTWTLHHT